MKVLKDNQKKARVMDLITHDFEPPIIIFLARKVLLPQTLTHTRTLL